MMMRRNLKPWVWMFGWLAASCVGTDVGNPQTQSEIEFVVPTRTTTLELGAENYTINTFRLHVSNATAAHGCNGRPESVAPSGYIDFLQMTKLTVVTNADVICRLQISFAKEGDSWLDLAFTHTDGRVIHVEATKPDSLKYRGEIPLGGPTLFSSHPVLDWFVGEKVALDALPDGAVINEDSYAPLHRSLLKSLLPDARLLVDANQNEGLDDADEEVALPEP